MTSIYVKGKGPCLYDSPIYYRATVLQDGTRRINSRVWPQDSDYAMSKDEAIASTLRTKTPFSHE